MRITKDIQTIITELKSQKRTCQDNIQGIKYNKYNQFFPIRRLSLDTELELKYYNAKIDQINDILYIIAKR